MVNKIKYYFQNFHKTKEISALLRWAKKSILPGFSGVSLYDSLEFVYFESLKDDILMRSRAISFSFFIALFPAIIFLLTLIPYLPFTDFYITTWKNSLEGILPHQVEKYIFDLMDELGKGQHYSSQIIAVILTLYFSSNGVSSILVSFHKSYKATYKERNYFQHKLKSLQITFLILMFLVISTGFIIAGNLWIEKLLNYFNVDNFSKIIIYVIKWFFVICITYTIIALLYRFGPALKVKIGFFSPGAGVATLLAIVSSLGFAYYVNEFNNYNRIYGSLGAIIITMIWIQLNSMALIVGYELNASIAVNKGKIKPRITNDNQNLNRT